MPVKPWGTPPETVVVLHEVDQVHSESM